jgi:hypothetical protein
VAAGQLGLTGGAQPIFVLFPTSTKNKYTTAQKICSNYSIRRWSFLFIFSLILKILNTLFYFIFSFVKMNFYILLLALISYIALASATTHMDDNYSGKPTASATTTNAAPARRQRFGFGLGRKV